jgi:hypothetical protein
MTYYFGSQQILKHYSWKLLAKSKYRFRYWHRLANFFHFFRLDDVKLTLSNEDSVGSKSRRKPDPVDPELAVTTLIPDTTVPVARARRQGDTSATSGQNASLLRCAKLLEKILQIL